MKPILEKLTPEPECSFVLQKDSFSYYPTPWRYHPEYELVLVLNSSGKKITGDHVSHFANGDLALIGPNLLHVYDNDPEYYARASTLQAEAIVIHFADDYLEKEFFRLLEMKRVRQLLKSAQQGLQIEGKARQEIARKMNLMLDLPPAQRLTELLNMLILLSQSDEMRLLASLGFVQTYGWSDAERLDPVFT